MTSISSLSTTFTSPLDLLKNELARKVSSGSISASDQSALSSALDNIDSALTAGANSPTSPLPPDQMKSKIDGLIQNEVSSGRLTSDQATELKNVFANTFSGGPRGAGGPGAGAPPPASSNDGDSDDTTSATSSTSSSTSTVDDLLKKLVAILKASDSSSSSSYGSDGSSASSGSKTSLLIDYRS